MKRLVLTCVVVLLAASSAIAQPQDYYVNASEGPFVIEINGDSSVGQIFTVGETVSIYCSAHALATGIAAVGSTAFTEINFTVTGPSGTKASWVSATDSSNAPSRAENESTYTAPYPLTAVGTHTVTIDSFAEITLVDAPPPSPLERYFSDSANASLTFEVVLPPPPVASDDAYTVEEDTTLTEGSPGVLANDTGGVLTAEYVSGSGPSNGILTLNSDGSFAYTPNPNWFGTDSFEYRAYDGISYSNIATVTITVVEVTPEEETEDLSDKVTDLIDIGALNQGQGNSLTSKLDKIIEKLENGQINVACNLLQAFINQVNSLISEGVLSSSEGQPLIDKAENIMMELGCS